MSELVRKAARAILLTPRNEVLLMRMAFPWRTDPVWILPGGGIKQDEDPEAAVVREVYEETGAADLEVAGEAWWRETFVDAVKTHLIERYFLVKCERFEIEPACLTEQETSWIRGYRWWSLSSLRSEKPNVEPARLADGIQALVQLGLLPKPVNIDR
jgi:2,3-bisphosphoglycerate-dependent phosphoglycerate mutase